MSAARPPAEAPPSARLGNRPSKALRAFAPAARAAMKAG